jgi:hypothetical protein
MLAKILKAVLGALVPNCLQVRLRGIYLWSTGDTLSNFTSALVSTEASVTVDTPSRRVSEKQRELTDDSPPLQSTSVMRATFDCGICLETFDQDDIARIDSCPHEFCRECIRIYISSELKERHFPVLCPVCKADKSTKDASHGGVLTLNATRHVFYSSFSVVTILLAEQIGITEVQREVWSELEIMAFAISIHCRGLSISIGISFHSNVCIDVAKRYLWTARNTTQPTSLYVRSQNASIVGANFARSLFPLAAPSIPATALQNSSAL